MKYIDAEKLIDELRRQKHELELSIQSQGDYGQSCQIVAYENILSLIDSLQRDEKAVELEMCSQAYWEEQGWIMIPPDVTIEGIDSLLEQVRKKLQQEQPEVDLEKFTKKIKSFQERYKHPEIVSIKGAMAFMARMFYQYPNVARQWYEQLPKATMD